MSESEVETYFDTLSNDDDDDDGDEYTDSDDSINE